MGKSYFILSSLPSLRRVLCFLAIIFLSSLPCFSQDFSQRVREAIKPLLTLQEPQKSQLIQVLTIYSDEFKTINLQLTTLSDNLEAERLTHKREISQMESDSFWGSVKVGLLSFAGGVILFEGLHLVGVIK